MIHSSFKRKITGSRTLPSPPVLPLATPGIIFDKSMRSIPIPTNAHRFFFLLLNFFVGPSSLGAPAGPGVCSSLRRAAREVSFRVFSIISRSSLVSINGSAGKDNRDFLLFPHTASISKSMAVSAPGRRMKMSSSLFSHLYLSSLLISV